MCEKLQKPTELEEVILWVSIAMALALLLLPYEDTNERPLPAIIFNGQPSSFHAFILALNFALFGSFLAIILRRSGPKIARYCHALATISLAIGIVDFFPFLVDLVAKFRIRNVLTIFSCDLMSKIVRRLMELTGGVDQSISQFYLLGELR
ncbi:hypothetical protein L484_026520 [Morus notabilis]|uniref:Uncharacterized protein n=1 Tax=Morus notabilis TaxID=981085 RepID=W9RAS0_9ROSA|nr:hypothetical protein L484_026520 [Morus notabilis]